MKSLCLFLMILIPNLHAEFNPKVIYSIKEISTKMDKNTLVLFDADETLVIDNDNAREDIDLAHLNGQQYMPIESDIAKTIEKIKSLNGIKTVLCLTKRGPNKGLISADVELQQLQIPLSRWKFKNFNGSQLSQTYPDIIFNNGVIYTAGKDKGTYLKAFCTLTKYKPKKIIMVDDKENNLKSVYEFGKKLYIPTDLYLMKGADIYKKAQ